MARLRHQTFVGLHELNAAISDLLLELNHRPFKKLPGTRQAYELALFSKARVNVDYHIEVDKHYYSVPYSFIKQVIDIRLTLNTVECCHEGVRIASHMRSFVAGKHTTLAEHMPPSHKAYAAWNPERLLKWALDIGPHTKEVMQYLLNQASHPEQSYRSCFGIMSLAKRYGNQGWKPHLITP